MKNNIKIPWLKIVLWAVFIHIILMALSILEVVVYSLLINPGLKEADYEQHAMISAPYISIIFGIIIFFFVTRLLTKKRYENSKIIALTLPLVYIILDLIIVILSGSDWTQHYLIFIISFATKIVAAYLGALSNRTNE